MLQILDLDFDARGHVMSDHRLRLRRLLVKLARDTKQLPSSIILKDLHCDTTSASGGGSYADIFQTTYGREKVALKRLRGVHMNDAKTQFVGFTSCMHSFL